MLHPQLPVLLSMATCLLRFSDCFQPLLQASVAAAMVTGVANRVLYKMALVPMGNYVFVLSQFQTFGYLLVYFGILATRFRYVMPVTAWATCCRSRLQAYAIAKVKQAWDSEHA